MEFASPARGKALHERAMHDALEPDALLRTMIALAREAGARILSFHGPTGVRLKADCSPVTLADEAAEAIILKGLREAAPGIPCVAEEAASAGHLPASSARFFLIDPLDGTKEFVAGKNDYTVNIALIEAGRPVMGVVYQPAVDLLYAAAGASRAFRSEGGGAPVAIGCRQPQAGKLAALASRSHRDAETDAFLVRMGIEDCVSAGSSVKFCRLAEGIADVYPRFCATMEWDTAAGHAILAAAGGCVTTTDGAPLTYGKPGYRNPGFIAWGAGQALEGSNP